MTGSTRRVWFSPVAFVLLLSAIIAGVTWPYRFRFPFDDVFISFRYAEHLASGYGIVWNIGHAHTEGYTNFLFIVILAVARLATNDLLAVSQLIGVLATTATAAIVYRIGYSRSAFTGILASALYLLTPLVWINALSGMETSLFVLFVAWTFLSASSKIYRFAFVLAFLATLIRPEGAILGLLVFGSAWSNATSRRRHVLQFAFGFLAPCVLYAIWKYLYFGDLLPNSFYLKVLGAHSRFPGLQYVRLFLTSALPLILAILLNRRLRDGITIVLAVWIGFLCTFYVFVLPLEGLYDRFLVPTLPALALLAGFGLHSRFKGSKSWVIGVVLMTANLIVMSVTPRTRQAFAAHEDVWDKSLDPIASLLHDMPNRDSVLVGYGDAGYVVYRSKIVHLDLFGLNDTRLAHARSKRERQSVIEQENPALLILPYSYSRDSCARLIENADGVAVNLKYKAVAAMAQFPNPVVFLLDTTSPHYIGIANYVARNIQTQSMKVLAPPACLDRIIAR